MKKDNLVQINDIVVQLLIETFSSKKANLPDNINWQDVLDYAISHMIDNTLFDTVTLYQNQIPKDVFMRWQKLKFKAFMSDETYEKERNQITNQLNLHKIKYMLLKGIIFNKYYPAPAMRQMADNDILVSEDELTDVIKSLNDVGFTNTPYDKRFHDISFHKSPITNFELHYSLTNKKDDNFLYFDKVWQRAIKCNDDKDSYEYEMTKEDFYIYNTYHFYGHYKRGGCGVKFLIDTYLFLKNEQDNLDFDYINNHFKLIGLTVFNDKMTKLAFDLFEGNELDDYQKSVLNIIIENGAFGSNTGDSMLVLNNENNSAGKFSKLKYINKKLFPSISFMQYIYPKCKKNPLLLPYYYIKRLVDKKNNGFVSISGYIKQILKSR